MLVEKNQRLIEKKINIKRYLETILSHNSWIMYQSEKESNTNGQVWTDLSHISWVLNRSGTNYILDG